MHYVHEIPLSLVNKQTNLDSLTSDMFEKHGSYLNPKIVSKGQIKRLLDKLVRNLYGGDKENA